MPGNSDGPGTATAHGLSNTLCYRAHLLVGYGPRHFRQDQGIEVGKPLVRIVGHPDREGHIRAGTVGTGDRVGQGGGTSRARRAGQRACAGGKGQTSRQAAWPGQSVGQRPRAAGCCRQLQIGDRRVKRVILVARCIERQAGVDHDRKGRSRAGTVGIGDRVGQGGGTSRARRAGQRACAGGKGQTRHTG